MLPFCRDLVRHAKPDRDASPGLEDVDDHQNTHSHAPPGAESTPPTLDTDRCHCSHRRLNWRLFRLSSPLLHRSSSPSGAQASAVRSHFVDVEGVDIHVEEQGAGPTIVLLHGFTGSASTMADIGLRLGTRRQLRIDLVGHGRSAVPEDPSLYSMHSTVRQVIGVIKTLADQPVDLVGYSLGGRVALSLLVDTPDLIRRATLIGASPGLKSAAERGERVAADEQLAVSIETDGIEQFVDHWMALPMWTTLRQAVTAQDWAESRRQRLSSNPLGLANSLRGVGTGAMPPLCDALTAITTPTQLLVGGLDAKFSTIAVAMAKVITTSEIATIADAGHAAHLEAPAITAETIVKFLR